MFKLKKQYAHIMEMIQAKYVLPIHDLFTFPVPEYNLMENHFPDGIDFHESMERRVLTGTSSP
jgi:hypothetical protein